MNESAEIQRRLDQIQSAHRARIDELERDNYKLNSRIWTLETDLECRKVSDLGGRIWKLELNWILVLIFGGFTWFVIVLIMMELHEHKSLLY